MINSHHLIYLVFSGGNRRGSHDAQKGAATSSWSRPGPDQSSKTRVLPSRQNKEEDIPEEFHEAGSEGTQ